MVSIMAGGSLGRREEHAVQAAVLLMRQSPQEPNSYVSRVLVEQHYDKDVYRLFAYEGDTLEAVFADFQKVIPLASLDRLIGENNLLDGKLPPLQQNDPEHEKSLSLTYTIAADFSALWR